MTESSSHETAGRPGETQWTATYSVIKTHDASTAPNDSKARSMLSRLMSHADTAVHADDRITTTESHMNEDDDASGGETAGKTIRKAAGTVTLTGLHQPCLPSKDDALALVEAYHASRWYRASRAKPIRLLSFELVVPVWVSCGSEATLDTERIGLMTLVDLEDKKQVPSNFLTSKFEKRLPPQEEGFWTKPYGVNLQDFPVVLPDAIRAVDLQSVLATINMWHNYGDTFQQGVSIYDKSGTRPKHLSVSHTYDEETSSQLKKALESRSESSR